MQEPRLDYVSCASPAGVHRMAYWEWGDPTNDQVLVCVHGLTRNGRDFDFLAAQLSTHYRVVCPDVVGRGRSDWLANPMFYNVPQYVSDMLTLLARLQPARLAWVGTSMGGLIGMVLAGSMALARRATATRSHPGGLPSAQSLHWDKLILNDVGPRIEPQALARIAQYVGMPGRFDSFAQAVAAMRSDSQTFGPHTEAQWEQLTRHVYLQDAGQWVKHYDLALAQPMSAQTPQALAAGEQLLWQCYEAIDCPILILRGEHSDLLSRATVDEMLQRQTQAQVHEVAGVGHAPTLMTAEQVMPVQRFLQT